jgi:transposase InsO family protein
LQMRPREARLAHPELRSLVARQNSTWGYTRIRGALYNLGHNIGRNTIKRILLDHGLDPAPLRGRTMSWETFLKPSGVKTVKLPARSPDLNAYAERFVRSVKSERLAKIIPLGERHLRKAVKEYTEHYHFERNHQGLDNELIEKLTRRPSMDAPVECWERLGGILNYYHRRAA